MEKKGSAREPNFCGIEKKGMTEAPKKKALREQIAQIKQGRAKNTKTLSSEFANLQKEHDYHLSQNKLVTQQLTRTKLQLQEDAKVVDELRNELVIYKKKAEDQRKLLSNQDRLMNQLDSERIDLNSRARRFEVSAKELEDTNNALQKSIDQLARKIASDKRDLEGYLAKIRTCELGADQLRSNMSTAKVLLITLLKSQNEHKSKVQALTEALQKSQEKSQSLEKTIRFAEERYKSLKTAADKQIRGLVEIVQKQQTDARLLKDAELASKQIEAASAMEKETDHKMAQNMMNGLLQDCVSKAKFYQERSEERDANSKKLEIKMQALLSELGYLKEAQVQAKAEKVDTASLQAKFNELQSENAHLRSQRGMFKVVAQSLQNKSRNKETQIRELELMIEKSNSEVRKIDIKRKTVEDKLDERNAAMRIAELKLEQLSRELKERNTEVSRLQKRVDEAVYQGEKQHYEAQQMRLLSEKAGLESKLSESAISLTQCKTRVSELEDEHKTMTLLQDKYQSDISGFKRLVEESAQWRSDLDVSRQLLEKKDRQIESLGIQLTTLVERNEVTSAREKKLREELQFAATQQEVEKLTEQLQKCRGEGSLIQGRLRKLEEIEAVLREQNQKSESKIATLMDLIRSSEEAKAQWKKDQELRQTAEAALQECRSKGGLVLRSLRSRLHAVEQQYSSSLLQHRKEMEKAELRISKLTNELDEAAQREQFREGEERLAMLRVKEEMAKKKLVDIQLADRELTDPDSGTTEKNEKRRKYEIIKKHVEARQVREERAREEERREQEERSKKEKLQKYAILKDHQEKRAERQRSEKQAKYAILQAHQDKKAERRLSEKKKRYEILKEHQRRREQRRLEQPTENDKSTPSVKQVIRDAESNVKDAKKIADLEELNHKYEDQLRKKEAEVIKAKTDTFNNLLSTITSSDTKGSSDLVNRVAELQTSGKNRENEKLKDLLELKAVSVVLNDATKRVNEQQKSLLENANMAVTANVVDLVKKDAPSPLILQNLGHHQRLNVALQANNIRSQDQLWREEVAQSQYQHQIQNELVPKLQELGDRLENVKVPEMNKFKQKVRQELSTLSAEPPSAPQPGARSDLERKLQEMTREADELADSVRAYIAQPGPQTKETVLEIERQRLEDDAQRRGALASMSNLAAQRSMEDIYSKDFRLSKDDPRDTAVSPPWIPKSDPGATPLTRVPKPLDINEALLVSSRSSRAVKPPRNLLVISHAHLTKDATTGNRTDKTDAAKFVIFQKTLQTMWDQVLAIAVENQISVRLVQISSDGTRSDLLGRHVLPKNCTAVNCQATRKFVTRITNEEEVMRLVAENMPADEDHSHLVLSLSSKGSDLGVHVVELLFKDEPKTTNDELNERLLDKTWVDFLRPILVQTDTSMIIQQIVLPQSMTSTNHSNEMLKNMNSLREFLTRLRQDN